MPSQLRRPTPRAKVPDRPEWIYEIKHDGYRLIVYRDGKRVRLFTSNGHDWTNPLSPNGRGGAAQTEIVRLSSIASGAAGRRRPQFDLTRASTMLTCQELEMFVRR